MKDTTNDYKTGWDKRQKEKEIQKKIAKTLNSRACCIHITSIVTDDSGASIVKFTWVRNCNTYLALISTLGLIKIYKEV